MISLNGGALSEQKLERYLARTNADTYTPIDRTDRFLARLCKEGYLVRTRENDGGEEVVEYMVGPRGKVEVGWGGVAGLVREVYGLGGGLEDLTPAEREERGEFEARLRGVLGLRVCRSRKGLLMLLMLLMGVRRRVLGRDGLQGGLLRVGGRMRRMKRKRKIVIEGAFDIEALIDTQQ